uniref:SH3 domain-containing protein n=1 Tax=Panagrellus redivivus TaxID=6233 RepID=A0A7E4URI5_PANRE
MSDDVYVVAKYDYAALDEVELSFKKGDRFKVIDDTKQWWKFSKIAKKNFFIIETSTKKAPNKAPIICLCQTPLPNNHTAPYRRGLL